MKKKLLIYIAVLLTMTMILTFTGCGDENIVDGGESQIENQQGNQESENTDDSEDNQGELSGEDEDGQQAENNSDNSGDNTQNEDVSEDPDEQDNTEGGDDASGSAAEKTSELKVTISESKNTYVVGESTMAETAYDSIDTGKSGGNYSNLVKSLNAYNKKAKNYCEDTCAILGSEAYNEKSEYPYAVEKHVKLRRTDEKVFSFVEENYYFAGGAHPFQSSEGYNYDAQTGQRLALTDVVTDVEAIKKKVASKLKKKYGTEGFYDASVSKVLESQFMVRSTETGEPSDALEGTDGTTFSPTWYLKDDRIVFIFNQYEIGPYAAGTFIAAVYFNGNEELFNEAYM